MPEIRTFSLFHFKNFSAAWHHDIRGCLSVPEKLVNYHKTRLKICYVFRFSTQSRLSDHKSRGGAEASEGPRHKWSSLLCVLPGLLGGLGQSRPAVPAVPVSLRWLSHYGGSPPQRPIGGPRCICHRSHTPQLSLLGVQRSGVFLRLSVLLFLG